MWDKLAPESRDALEAFTEGLNVDPVEMDFFEVEDLVQSLNALKGIFSEGMTTEGVIASLQGIKTEAGEAAASVREISDQQITVDVSDISAVSDAWSMEEGQVRTILASLSGAIQNANG